MYRAVKPDRIIASGTLCVLSLAGFLICAGPTQAQEVEFAFRTGYYQGVDAPKELADFRALIQRLADQGFNLVSERGREGFPASGEYYKKKGQTIDAQVVVEETRGCQAFDDECKRILTNLNAYRPDWKDPSYEGPVRVPVYAYRIDAVVEAGDKIDEVRKITADYPDNIIGVYPVSGSAR